MIRSLLSRRPVARWALIGLVAGCRNGPADLGFSDVQADLGRRTGQRVQWDRMTASDHAAADAVRRLLIEGLDDRRAVQVALLNNKRLQATYEDLGVAQAEVVQAGLLKNPLFNGDVKFGVTGGGTDIELAVVGNFLDVFMIPLRTHVAQDRFEIAKLRVSAAVIRHAGQTRTRYYEHVTAEQVLALRKTIAEAEAASFDFARRLHDAGNLSDYDFATDRVAHEQAKLDLTRAEAVVPETRERLGVMMGVSADMTWKTPDRLPDPPAMEIPTNDLERQAVMQSLELGVARRRIDAAARVLGTRKSFGLFPDGDLGVAAERETDGEWGIGPAVSVPVPLFDQGQAAAAAARAELARARQQFAATAVEVRSAARVARNRLAAARAAVDQYRSTILPLRHDVTRQAQLHYNGMFIGASQLLQARQNEVETGIAYVNALRDYWLARTQVDQVISGRSCEIPDADPAAEQTTPGASDRFH